MNKPNLLSIAVIATTLGLAACGSDDNKSSSSNNSGSQPTTTPTTTPTMNSYEFSVEVLNLTTGQPLSPPAVVIHNSGYVMFDEAQVASTGLEYLAEGGSNSQVLEGLDSNDAVLTTHAAEMPIVPGAKASYSITFDAESLTGAYATIATMLVHTNDAFTGEKNISIADLTVNQSLTVRGPVWDAGTEANTETAATIPGPAANGEGFNAERNDIVDRVVFHTGVVTADDGLATSSLNQYHRFDQPASQIRITRVK